MKYVVGVDTGGTFTDLIAVDEVGEYLIVKTPSTPADPSLAVIEGLRKAGEKVGKDLPGFLADVTRICHGTTVSTNTVLTWSGAKVGMLCTEGFRDTLEIRFGIRENPYDYTIPAPKALAPRYLRVPIEERIKWDGSELKPLNEQQVRDACKYLLEQGAQAVVVGFVWSFKNKEHERRAVEICREEMPGIYVIGSCDIAPEIREYWRISTAVLSAYVGPALTHYLTHMVQTLGDNGFVGQLLVTQSNAGVMFPEIAIEQAARTLLSGPACAPAAAAYIASPLKLKDLITCDMGGTSFDVALIKNEKPSTALEGAVGGVYHFRLPMVDVHTIGAGGGSIGWLDAMNVLHMGPASAGADPGPACYGRGGVEPTSTDADLVLGYLDKDYFLGGEMKVDVPLAEKAIKEKIADPLGMTVVEAAKAMRKIIDHSMSDAISEVSVQRGEDPRRYALVAAGGAGPVHIASLAQVLNIKQIVVPRSSSIFCAIGSIIADLRHDLVTSVVTKTSTAEIDGLNEVFAHMKGVGDGYLEREGIAAQDKYYAKSIDMRYLGQFHEVELPISEAVLNAEEVAHIVGDFHKKHEELYAYSEPESETEWINLRLATFGRVVPPARKARTETATMDASRHIKGQRDVYFEEKFGFVPTFIYDGDAMEVGNILEGPAIIEQSTTTIVVPPGARVDVTEYGDYLMNLA
jgi:N-methylhydantoinase A